MMIAVLTPTAAFAGQGYQVLQQLPGGPSGTVSDGGISYFAAVYNVAVSLAIILSITMIVIGGIQYIASGISPSQKNDAKQRITYAIGGLLLALMSFLILQTIDPDLVKLQLPSGNSSSASILSQ